MSGGKLKNAPLKEAIFEIFWKLPLDPTGFPIDPELDLALGKFANLMVNFPIHKRLIPPGNRIRVARQPVHQFWTNELTWPVIQLGPGILTVNETDKNYDWNSTYRNTIHDAIKNLNKSYRQPLIYDRITLRYVDSIDLKDANIDLSSYIGSHFNVQILNKFEQPGPLSGININQIFKLPDLSLLTLNIQTAKNNSTGEPAILWITSIEKNGKIGLDEIFPWLDNMHNICSDIFVKMLNPDFYATFH